jgi:hypothetical protein
MDKKMKISQSLMKDLQDYLNHEMCGLVFKARHVDHLHGNTSEAMLLGQYFEYIATGQLPKYGNKPQPRLTKNGELSEPFKKAHESALYSKAIIQALNIEVKETGSDIEFGDMKGTLDIFAYWDGKPCIIDYKYSGLLDNKWDDRGWNLDTLSEKHKLLIQAVHYKYILEQIMNQDVEFYFFLFSSTNPSDVRVVKVIVDDLTIMRHLEDVKKAKMIMETLLEDNNFKARPSLQMCSTCFLKENCPSRALLPTITTIYY